MKNNRRTVPIIHIIGLPGAGKTTLSRILSGVLKVPVFRIGHYRARFPQTAFGEADAWLALFRELSRRKWKNCILETTGLNSSEAFLKTALPVEQIFTVKLEASCKTLMRRIRKKKKKDRGANGFTARNTGINTNLLESSISAFVKFQQIVILIPIDWPGRQYISAHSKRLK